MDYDLTQYTDFVGKIVAKSIPEQDVDDLTQDVLLSVLSKNSFCGRNGAAFETFLGRVTRNKIVDYYRKRQGGLRFISWTDCSGSYNPWREVDNRILLEQVLVDLPDNYRLVINEHLADLSYSEIAENHSLGYEGARSLSRRARAFAGRRISK